MNNQDLAGMPEDVREVVENLYLTLDGYHDDDEVRFRIVAIGMRKALAELLRLARENAELQFHLHDQELLAKANAEHATERLKRAERDEAELDALKNLQFELAAQVVRAEKAEAELAALKKRIDGAPTCTLRAIVQGNIVWPVASDLSGDTRVALLPVGGE